MSKLSLKMNVCLLILLIGLLAGRPALAEYSRGGAFTAPNYGARAWGMGGAAIASIGGEESVSWNPAMMSCLGDRHLGASFVNLVSGATAYHSHLAYAMTFQRMDSGDLPTPVSTHAVGAMFSNLHLDLYGGSSYNENAFRVAYAWSPDYFISFGAAVSLLAVSTDYYRLDAQGSSVDAGLRLNVHEDLTFAFVARNAVSRLFFDDDFEFSLSRSYTMGLASTNIPYLLVEGDVVFAHGAVSRYVMGAESKFFADILAIRAGLSSLQLGESRTIPHLGIGVKFQRFQVNYNANLDSDKAFESTHRFSLSATL